MNAYQSDWFKPRKFYLQGHSSPVRGLLAPHYEKHTQKWAGFIVYDLQALPCFVSVDQVLKVESTSIRCPQMKTQFKQLGEALKQEYEMLKRCLELKVAYQTLQSQYEAQCSTRERLCQSFWLEAVSR